MLDVWEGEPETDRHWWTLTDIATPHIAGYSVDGKANATINSVRVVAAELGIPLARLDTGPLPRHRGEPDDRPYGPAQLDKQHA